MDFSSDQIGIKEENHEDEGSPKVAAKKTKYPRTADLTPNKVDASICNFFSKFGLSSDIVRDTSFIQLVYSLGGSLSLPNPTSIDVFVKKRSNEYKRETHSLSIAEPMTVTIDVLKTKTENFIAFSAHYFDGNFLRNNIVFLKKLATLENNENEIMNEMRKSVFPVGKMSNFTNLVTTNSLLEKAFYKTGKVTNSYICYSSYVSNFAEALVRHSQFCDKIELLKDFFVHIRSSQGFYCKLQRFIALKRATFDLPETDHSKWTGLSSFLSQVIHLHDYLKEFAEKHALVYIDDETHEILSSLQLLLAHLQNSLKKCSTPESSVSQVIPEIVELKKFIDEGKLSTQDVKKCFNQVFNSSMQPLLGHYRGGCYEFATLLDPRYAYEEDIFSGREWLKIRQYLKEDLLNAENLTITKTKLETMIEKELKIYEKAVLEIRLGSLVNPFKWWSTKADELPILFAKALVVLCPPPCAIDAEYFFGKRGKMTHMNGKMPLKKFNDWLVVAGSQEKFRGRGCPEDEPVQLELYPIRDTNGFDQLKGQELSSSSKKRKYWNGGKEKEGNFGLDTVDRQIALETKKIEMYTAFEVSKGIDAPVSNEDFTVKEEPLDEDIFENMLMQPPPEKRSAMSPTNEEPSTSQMKTEESDFMVKNEVKDDYNQDYNMCQPGTSRQAEKVIFKSNSNCISFSTMEQLPVRSLGPVKRAIPISSTLKASLLKFNKNIRNCPIAPNLPGSAWAGSVKRRVLYETGFGMTPRTVVTPLRPTLSSRPCRSDGMPILENELYGIYEQAAQRQSLAEKRPFLIAPVQYPASKVRRILPPIPAAMLPKPEAIRKLQQKGEE